MSCDETTAVDGNDSLRVKLVTSWDQFAYVTAIRSVCYTDDSDTKLPFDDAFDGNDFQASHIIAYLGNEPIGALRIRWFANFAKIERTGFRPEYRPPRHLQKAAPFVFNHIARKGYARAITHAAPKYAAVWRRYLGFRPVDKPAGLYKEGSYIELVKGLDIPGNVITADSDINVLSRVEGDWDVPNNTKSCLKDACRHSWGAIAAMLRDLEFATQEPRANIRWERYCRAVSVALPAAR